MEHSSTHKNIPSSFHSRQEETRTSRFDKNTSTDSTVVSSNSTAIAYDTEFNGESMNQNEDTEQNGADKTITLGEFTKSIPNNTTRTFQRLYQDNDSDIDLSPNFTSPHTLKHNLMDQNKILDYKKNNKTNDTVRSDSLNKGIRTVSGLNKRNISQLRKQLGEPLPLPYKVSKETVPSNNISVRKASVKYVSPIRRQSIANNLSNTPQVDQPHIKPLTIERLEEKRSIITNRWKDLLIKDRVKVEEKLKELRSWDEENKSITAPFNHERHHSLSTTNSTNVHNLRKPSTEHSVFDTHRNSHSPFDSLDDLSDMSDMSVLKLQQEIETNSQKLDRILAVLEGASDVKTTSKRTALAGTNFSLLNVSINNLLWTICIFTLLICQLYVWFYL
ncbi:hypothetical protein MOSE0_N13740 [Monosporozyma servazzii]